MATVYEFNYTGSEQSVTLKPGKYQIECWGANGGSNANLSPEKYKNACGGYTTGIFAFNENKNVYIYVGKDGTTVYDDIADPSRRGFNGAGLTYEYVLSSSNLAFDGGGATDVRTIGGAWDNPQGLLSRFIVAGGGGGWTNDKYTGGTGKGGGFTSNDLEFCIGASQTAGGIVNDKTFPTFMNGSFGKGGGKTGYAVNSNRVKYGGGGGWFGGACGITTSGSGGSGYLLSVNSYKPSGYLVDSSFYALDGSTNSLTPETYNSPIFPSCHGFCRITLLQGFMSVNVNSYTSTQAKFTVSHTEEGALKKIDWYLDGVLKETFMTDLYTEKIINYELIDNAIHTLKIIATDNTVTSEKVLSISKSIMPLEDDASLQDIASKVSEIKEGLINGKTSIINVLALKNIESSLNNTLVELSDKVKTSFDSTDASVQELQNQLTEKNNNITQLNRTISSLQQEINSRVQFYKKTYLINTFGTGIEEGGYKSSRYGDNYFLLPFKPRYIAITSTAPSDVYPDKTFLVHYIYSFDVDGSFSPTNSEIGFLNVTNSKVIDECCYPFISNNPESLGKTMIRLNCYGSGNGYVSNITIYAFS
ncbi:MULTISPECIES: glycine rich domain-containing protein [unclassified Clostridioides]|uniref:glycine rich domain-containing protein n=1 Tax=unclassified Clostridioides TaxID=2635829 RepID=UPI001D12C0CF|nr:hypothetical protein [Clostridioides sp. ES-S-0049-03]MCC0677985.1 hypothetical protein [Clostridioides sp. ES-W-0018-02]MCC0712632.1 hypothetical protein [Clostridioides sp. ES-W-0017-02]